MKRPRGLLILIVWSTVIGLLMLSRAVLDILSIIRPGPNGPVGISIGHQLVALTCLVPLFAASVIAFLVSGTKAALLIDAFLAAAHMGVAVTLLGAARKARSGVAVWMTIHLLALVVFFVHSVISGPFYFPSFRAEVIAFAFPSFVFYLWALIYVLRISVEPSGNPGSATMLQTR